jgi:hypothetical protein
MGNAQLEAFPSASIAMEILPECLAPEGEENLLRNHLHWTPLLPPPHPQRIISRVRVRATLPQVSSSPFSRPLRSTRGARFGARRHRSNVLARVGAVESLHPNPRRAQTKRFKPLPSISPKVGLSGPCLVPHTTGVLQSILAFSSL